MREHHHPSSHLEHLPFDTSCLNGQNGPRDRANGQSLLLSMLATFVRGLKRGVQVTCLLDVVGKLARCDHEFKRFIIAASYNK